ATLALLVIYLAVYFSIFYQGFAYGGGLLANRISGFEMLWERLVSPDGQVFILVNLLPLGIFVLFSGYRYILLAIGAVLPHFLFTIGGAELTGWSTHYHTMYIPLVIFTACVGYERIMRWA